jgi:hypothetical protein
MDPSTNQDLAKFINQAVNDPELREKIIVAKSDAEIVQLLADAKLDLNLLEVADLSFLNDDELGHFSGGISTTGGETMVLKGQFLRSISMSGIHQMQPLMERMKEALREGES